MLQIAYFSNAAVPQDAGTIEAILASSRRNNQRDDVTGLLLAGGSRYLQLVEGPDAAVEALLDRLRADSRHAIVETLLCRSIHERCFVGSPLAYGAETHLGEIEDAAALLHFLSSHVEDAHLRRQIRGFAHLFIVDRRVDTLPWPAPDTPAPLFG